MQSNFDQGKIQAGALTVEENRFTGHIPMKIWTWWFLKGGLCLNILNFLFHFMIVGFTLGGDWWVGIWAEQTYSLSGGNYVLVYFLLMVGMIVTTASRYAVWGTQISVAANRIYSGLMHNLLRRPMSFFDTTQVGQILNRVGKDAEDMDVMLPRQLANSMGVGFRVFGGIILACAVMPFTIVIVVLMVFFIAFLSKGYIRTSTELRRLFQISSSPIISTIAEMITGLTTIRVFQKTQFMLDNFNKNVEINNQVFVHEKFVSTWMIICMETSMAVLIAFIAIFVVLTRYIELNSTSNANTYGFVLSTVCSLAAMLPMLLFT